MSRFYLLWHPGTNRMVIDRSKVKGYEVQKEIKASCWIEAKKLLGFELTPLQQDMLNEKNNSTEAGRRVVRYLKDAGAELRAADGQLQDGGEAGPDSELDLQQVLCEEGLL